MKLAAVILFASVLMASAPVVIYRVSAAAGETFQYVQGKGAQSANDTTVVISFDSLPTAGHTVVVAVAGYQVTWGAGDVTDNQSNTYTLQVVQSSNDADCAIYTANNVNSSGTFTVTVDPSATVYPAMVISEWEGVDNTTPVDDSSNNSGTSTGPDTGSITASDAVVAVVTQASSTATITEDGGYTLIYEAENSSSQMPISCIYKEVSGADNPGWTLQFSYEWGAAGVSLQAQ